MGFSASLTLDDYRNQPVPNSTWTWEVRGYVTVNNGHGTTNTQTVVLSSGTESGTTSYVDVSLTVSGSVSASVGVDKLWDIAEDSFSSTSAPTRFPSLTGYTWYERTTDGSTAACSLTVNGSAVTASGAATSRRNADYTATLSASGFSSGDVTPRLCGKPCQGQRHRSPRYNPCSHLVRPECNRMEPKSTWDG